MKLVANCLQHKFKNVCCQLFDYTFYCSILWLLVFTSYCYFRLLKGNALYLATVICTFLYVTMLITEVAEQLPPAVYQLLGSRLSLICVIGFALYILCQKCMNIILLCLLNLAGLVFNMINDKNYFHSLISW